MRKIYLLSLLIYLMLSSTVFATDWYVRPSGGNYGSEDGTSYNNAWDGFSNIVWGAGGVDTGDTLWVCGAHNEKLTIGSSGINGSEITIRGDYSVANGTIGNTSDRNIDIYDHDYITVKNITLLDTPTNKDSVRVRGNYLTIDTVDINNAGYNGIYFIVNNNTFTNLTIKNCYIDGIGTAGYAGIAIYISATSTGTLNNVILNNNELTDNYYGIRIRSDSTSTLSAININSCKIYGNIAGIMLADIDTAIGTNSISSCQIYNNDASSTSMSTCGITIASSNGFNVFNNILHDNSTCSTCNDGSGIDLDTDVYGCTVCNNICYNHTSCTQNIPFGAGGATNSAGIMWCCGAHDNVIKYNLCYNNIVGIQGSGSGDNNLVLNNTLVDNVIGIHTDIDAGITGTVIKNNIIAQNTYNVASPNYDFYEENESSIEDYNCFGATPSYSTGFTKGTNSIEVDPLLSDNYYLELNSPCIDAGTKLSIHDSDWRDLDGNTTRYGMAPDIGCYEYHTWPLGAWGQLPWTGNKYKLEWTAY